MNVRSLFSVAAALAVLVLSGCYAMRSSHGGGETKFEGLRRADPASVALAPGYRIDVIATDLTFPTGVATDDDNRVYVVESGYSYGEVWTQPRLVRIEGDGKATVIARGGRNGPWNGVDYADGAFFIAEGGELEGGRILRISSDGQQQTLIANLPSKGDHHTNGPRVGADGRIYFGQGTATNSGVVGEDNAQFGWLKRFPDFHDIACKELTLTGQNFVSSDPLGSKAKVTTGAYAPFATASRAGQTIAGAVPCSGAILRIPQQGGPAELVAWGLRNPFGLAFDALGTLYVTENGYDDRGSRPVWGTPDVLWKIEAGGWYGWPDFAAGMPLTDPAFRPPGKPQPRFLLMRHPATPPRPAAIFAVHSSSNGFDFSRSADFGHVGEAFVAQFGDQAPDTGKVLKPVGFKVVRVNVETGEINDFAVNIGRTHGPASLIGGGGLERPVAARFDRTGSALYVVDFGVMTMSAKGPVPRPGTGVLWRITRAAEP